MWVSETTYHIFFNCIMAKNSWTCFKEALGWDRVPRILREALDYWFQLHCKDYHIKFLCLPIVL